MNPVTIHEGDTLYQWLYHPKDVFFQTRSCRPESRRQTDICEIISIVLARALTLVGVTMLFTFLAWAVVSAVAFQASVVHLWYIGVDPLSNTPVQGRYSPILDASMFIGVGITIIMYVGLIWWGASRFMRYIRDKNYSKPPGTFEKLHYAMSERFTNKVCIIFHIEEKSNVPNTK